MKEKTLIIVCFLFLFKLGMGQEYEKIVDTTKMWVVLDANAAIPNTESTYALKIKDSVLLTDQLHWFKLWKATDSTYSDWKHEGYIRETNKIVFYQKKDLRRIDTLYNFNKKVGDTLFYIVCFGTILTTETVNFAGKPRLVQNIESPFFDSNTKHYEGIGSALGVVTPFYYCYSGAIRMLLCYFKDGELLYKDPKYSECYFRHVSINEGLMVDIKITPNPTNGDISFDLPKGYVNPELHVFSVFGKQEGIFKLSAGKNELSLTHLSAGVYGYYISNSNNIITKGKLIIN